jgi:hypothetical protein
MEEPKTIVARAIASTLSPTDSATQSRRRRGSISLGNSFAETVFDSPVHAATWIEEIKRTKLVKAQELLVTKNWEECLEVCTSVLKQLVLGKKVTFEPETPIDLLQCLKGHQCSNYQFQVTQCYQSKIPGTKYRLYMHTILHIGCSSSCTYEAAR